MKKYLTQAHITTAFAIVLVILNSTLFDVTENVENIVYIIAGIFGALGYTVPTINLKRSSK